MPDQASVSIYQSNGGRCSDKFCAWIGPPREGTLVIEHSRLESEGLVHVHGIHASLDASSEELLIAAARALRPMRVNAGRSGGE